MTDIVERLRRYYDWDGTPPEPKCPTDKDVLDEFARLRRQRDELLEALEAFVQFHSGHVLPLELRTAMFNARTAISKAKGEA